MIQVNNRVATSYTAPAKASVAPETSKVQASGRTEVKPSYTYTKDGVTVEIRNADKDSVRVKKQEDNANKEQAVSTVGRTEDELKMMYLRGDISKSEYDRAVSLREERRNKVDEEEKLFSNEMTGIDGLSKKAERDMEEIKKLYGPYSSKTFSSSVREQFLEEPQEVTTNMLVY